MQLTNKLVSLILLGHGHPPKLMSLVRLFWSINEYDGTVANSAQISLAAVAFDVIDRYRLRRMRGWGWHRSVRQTRPHYLSILPNIPNFFASFFSIDQSIKYSFATTLFPRIASYEVVSALQHTTYTHATTYAFLSLLYTTARLHTLMVNTLYCCCYYF